MEQSSWCNEQINQLESIIEGCTKLELSKCKINWLQRLIKKVDVFQESCPTCNEYKPIIEDLVLELDSIIKIPDYNMDNYNSQIASIHKHLKTVHHVVTERHYMHLGTIIGVVVGVSITLLFMNKSSEIERYGLWVGVLIGLFTGKYLDKKAESAGRLL